MLARLRRPRRARFALLLTFGTAPVWIVLATGAALVAVGYRAAEALVGARDGIAGARAG
jgi:hypothetical protein